MVGPVREHRPLRTLSWLAGSALVLLAVLLGSTTRGDASEPRWTRSFVARADTDSVVVATPGAARADTDSVVVALPEAARADTDSVAVQPLLGGVLTADSLRMDSLRALIDSLGVDSLRALINAFGADSLLALVDSLAPPDTAYRVRRYLAVPRNDGLTASLFPRPQRPFSARMSDIWRHELKLDSTGQFFIARETVGETDVRYPLEMDPERYRQEMLTASLQRNWRLLADQRATQRRQRQRGGVGLNITVPGGRQSAFTTIFGKNEVDLRVTGNADIKAAMDYRKSDQQVTLGTGSQLDPDFKQNLRLGVAGTIGDKMRVDVNWDTERDFDYQNQLKLQYTGYEDEILQRVEAGNVFLQTPSTLIRGGQSLFGIKSEFKVGGVRLTTVASQQEGQSNSLSLEGGAETTEFTRKPTDYDERTHFFLGYYFRNRWEDALSLPPTIVLDPQFEGLTDIEVWKLQPVSPEEQNVRQVVALVDLGEPQNLITDADAYTTATHPDDDIDQYTDEEIQQFLRPGDQAPKDYLESIAMDVPLDASGYQVGQFKKLTRGRDYEIDELLGFITLKQRMQESEALAVSFRYLSNGTSVQVGDFSTQTGGGDNSQTGDRLVLKLLKPVNLKQPANDLNPAAWYLEMRNIYQLERGLSPTEFQLQIAYEPPGKSGSKTLPGVTGQRTLLQELGLDRINEDGSDKPDNLFDYLPNYSIVPGDGLLIFPYLEPFGQRIEQLIAASNLSEAEQEAAREQFVFDDLYRQKKINAQRNTQLDVYRIQGSSKGSIPSFYDLRAFSGLIEGSVRVTSGGTPLSEGTDYIVDYQGGSVTIINPSHLTAGRTLAIDYEQNALINLQKKTLLGARLDYCPQAQATGAGTGACAITEGFALGATVMRLSQKSLTDKFRIGEEPIANTVWGLDGQLVLEPRWLTRAIDALPLLQTKEPSAINITGEFAQLLPGHTETNAFQDERRDLRNDGRDFNADEVAGISYVDDFESFENLFSLNRPGTWLLGSAPIIGVDTMGVGVETPLTNNTRAAMGWYQINATTLDQLGAPINDPVFGVVTPQQVFPNREVSSQERTLTTLDLYFSPHERGPYNYNTDLGGFLDDPKQAWGAMTQHLSEGNTDFTSKNIEFIEFVFQPFAEGGEADPDARLYVDLGLISEDIIPDNKLNTEDGLSLTEGSPVGTQARLSTGQQDQVINPITGNITEDLGLDGLASFPGNLFENQEGSEAVKFQGFLDSLNTTSSARFPEHLAREIAKAQRDPSGDDYQYFLNDGFYENGAFYPSGGATVQQRFAHYFAGHELNSFEAQEDLSDASTSQGNSRFPDSEDLNINSTLDTESSYFQYELPLNLTQLDELAQPDRTDDYVVEEIKFGDGNGTGWYLVRIPVKDFTRRVGTIQDFSLIESIRLWTQGHTTPITMRFATLEFVGSQWRKSITVSGQDADGTMLPPEDPLLGARISIESVNNEENSTYAIPMGTVRSRIREASTGRQRDAREQAMVLRAENLKPGQQQAVFQTYSSGHDLLKYFNLRMFAHLDGLVDGMPLQEQDRDKVRLFVRLGANETNDYYEYEQPLTPSPLDQIPEGEFKADYLWRTREPNPNPDGPDFIDVNSMNILLGALNQLKFVRDEDNFPTDSVFWSDNPQSPLQDDVSGPNGFAPAGARLAIKGTPSLGNVTTIVVGVRNPADEGGSVLEDVNVWINELRVSGYDEEKGTAALVNADIQLADLARVKANFRMQTSGFGALSSSLGERDQVNARDWAVNTQLNLDKFIPERFGWTIPVTVEAKSSTATPHFDPNRGDVRVDDLLDAIDDDETLTAEEIQLRKDQITEQAQTQTVTRSFTSRVQKINSRSGLLRYTIDGLSYSYSFSESEGRTPNQTMRDSWRWTSTLGYRLTVRNPATVRPFGFLDDVPVLKALGGLRFNYLPTALNLTASANRNFSETKERPDPVRRQADVQLPVDVEFPLRPQHTFTHNRQFSLQYNPFGFLNLTFDTNTDQSLNPIGVDTLFTLIQYQTDEEGNPVRDEEGNLIELRSEPSTQDLLRAGLLSGEIDSTAVGVTAFQVETLNVVPFQRSLNRALSNDTGPSVRTERYESRFNATFRPKINKFKPLDWINVQDFGYGVTFSWRNGSAGNNTGATIGTNVTLRGGVTVNPQDLFRKIGLYRKLEEQQTQAETDKQARRQQREQERKERREQKRVEKEQRRQEKAAEKAAEEARKAAEEAAEEARKAAEEAGLPPPPEPEEDEPLEEPAPEIPDAAPEADVEADSLAAEADSTKGGGLGIKLPLPNPLAFLRRAFLAATGVRDLAVSYNGTRRTDATNIGQIDENGDVVVHYSLLDALGGQGPPLRYRLGLDRAIDPNERLINERLQVTDALSNSDRFQGRTTINPTQTLRISLNWTLEKNNRDNITYRRDDAGLLDSDTTQVGDNRASVWAFGASYLDLFTQQLEQFRRDCGPDCAAGGAPPDTIASTVLTNEDVFQDFLDSYLSGLGTLGSDGRLPIPLPGWQINYTGISSWPIIRWLTQSATLRHNYSADYSADFRSNLVADLQDAFTLQGGPTIVYAVSDIEIGAVRINERYQPLVALDLTLKGNIQASIALNKSNTYSLSTTNNIVSETKTNEMTFSASYQKTGMTLPFFKNRLNNRINFSLTLSRSVNDDRTFAIRRAIEAAALDPEFDPALALKDPFSNILTTTSRLQVSPKIAYQFSNRVTADVFVQYERFKGDSRRPSTTSVNGGFNIRVSISN